LTSRWELSICANDKQMTRLFRFLRFYAPSVGSEGPGKSHGIDE
jgi:hypothetical protein